MALYWSGARVKVRYEDGMREDELDYPEDTLVIVMKPGQEGSPSFARAVRHLVTLRTIEEEMGREAEREAWPRASAAHEVAAREAEDRETAKRDRPAARGDERERGSGVGSQAELEAERRFVETFLADDELGLGFGDEALFGMGPLDEDLPLLMRDLIGHETCPNRCGGACGGWPERGMVQLVVEHCDKLVVGA